MAMIRLENGDNMEITAEVGAQVWLVLNAEIEGTKEQQEFAETVKKLYLNWRNAPDSYIQERLADIIPMATSGWVISRDTNKPLRPEPGDEQAWAFAKRWGLWENGQKTQLVDRPELARQFQRELISSDRKDLA